MTIIELAPDIVEPEIEQPEWSEPEWFEVTDTPIAAVLQAARHLLSDPDRWTKHTLNDGHGRYCALGALYAVEVAGVAASMRNRLADDAAYILETTLHGTKHFMASVPAFNDEYDTTHAQVLHLFDLAIARAKAQRL